MDSVGGASFLEVAAVIGQREVIVNKRVVLLIREIFEPIV